MKSIVIGANDGGQRLDRFVMKALPLLPSALAQKYIRLKRFKVGGKALKRDSRLVAGDVLDIYISDEFFQKPSPENRYLTIMTPRLSLVYEDENLLLINKPAGISVHPGDGEAELSLVDHLRAYLYQSGQWRPREENSFAPALCNRIDRNTQGLVIAAKNAEALRVMNEKIRLREISKFYLCLVRGRPEPPEGRLENYIFKDAVKNQVYVRDRPEKGARTAVTLYRTLAHEGGVTLLECELLTGRTHQIRAQLAAAGYPLAGDGKYGRRDEGRKYQALCSWKLRFDFPTDAGVLSYLRGRIFTVEDCDFVRQYFPTEADKIIHK